MAGSADDHPAEPTTLPLAAPDTFADGVAGADASAASPVEDSTTSPVPRLTADTEIGRYRLVARLGAGAMGVVWSAVDPQLERKVAIKVVHPRLASAPEASQRMLREARAMAKLSHRAVVTVHDAGEADGRLFLAMELVDGETLTQRLRRPDLATPGAWSRRLALALEAGRGLAAAHAAGVLHRDFKPDNVLVDAQGRVAVGDFGLATLGAPPRGRSDDHADPMTSDQLELTTTGALLGTPMYMSPQQLRGNTADARGDQFAFCVAAYEAVYGVRPFAVAERGLDAIPALIAAIEAGRLEPGDAAAEVPSAVREVLRRGLSADPSARWPDLPALLAALDTASGARARRHRRIGLVAAGVVLFALAAAAGAVGYRRTQPAIAHTRPLFSIARGSTIALGPDGHTIAIGYDHLEIHDDRLPRPWSIAIPPAQRGVVALSLEADEVSYATAMGGAKQTWRYREEDQLAPDPLVDRAWIAPLGDDDLYVDGHAANVTELLLVHGGAVVRTWPMTYHAARLLAGSPDHRRIAYIEDVTGDLVVIGVDGTLARSAPIQDATAIAWRDPQHVLVARGTQVLPAILELELSDDSRTIGPPRMLFEQETGWFMQVASRDGRIVILEGNPVSRTRVFGAASRDYEPARVAGEIGWLPDGELLGWNRTTNRLTRIGRDEAVVDAGIALDHEPANATMAGDLWIVTVRTAPRRAIEAFDLRTGARVWTRADLSAVRCADDHAPPCVALRATPSGVEILNIDPATGALGSLRDKRSDLNDVAVTGDGHLWLVGESPFLRKLDADDREVATIQCELATLRSVASAPDGRLVVSGTVGATTYAVGYVDPAAPATTRPAFRPIMTSDTELLLLARASPDGASIAVMGRTYPTELDELVLP